MRRKWMLAICAVAACLALLISGCSSSSYAPPSSEPTVSTPTISENGLLRVGVNTGNAPLAGMGNDKIIGIDVDIAAAIADYLGLKLSIIDVGNNPNGALSNNTVDVVLGIDSSDAGDAFWLSKSYLSTGVAAFASEESAPVPKAGSGETFAAQTSSKSAWAVQNEFGANALKATTNLNDAFENLSSGTVDYVAADAIIGYYAAHSQDISAYIVALLLQPSGYCAGVSYNNISLQNAITEALDTLSSNGVIDVIEMKWLGATLDLSDVPLTAGANSATQSESSQSATNQEGGLTTGTNAVDTSSSSSSSSSSTSASSSSSTNTSTNTSTAADATTTN